jgi:predicted amidohydrolase YtcJ
MTKISNVALLSALLIGAGTPVGAAEIADRIWFGGPVITMNDAAMRAEAVAERGGKILAVGSRAQVMKLKGAQTQMIDLKGRAMLPGFVDAHGHVTAGGLQALSANLLAPPDGKVNDLASLQATMRDWMKANEAIVKQINLAIGFGYDPSTMKEQRHPTREDLDQISRDVPILLVHQSGHIGALNSKALEVVGITAATPDPSGGVIRRKQGGQEPDGVIEESAFFPVLGKILTQIGPDGARAFVRAGTDLWARYGYTTAQEGRSSPGVSAILRQVAKDGGLKIDVAAYEDVLVDRNVAKQTFSASYADRFRVAGLKLTIDGSAPAFTAWRDRPYFAPVGNYPKGYLGYPAVKPEQVTEAIEWAYANNLQILTHANGERASDLLIAAHDLAQMKYPDAKDRRDVLIHGLFMREDQMASFKRLNITPSLFPMHTFYWGDWHTSKTMGPVAGRNIAPVGWARSRDMRFTSHHDAPVAFPDSMRVLDATVTRVARGSGKIVGPEHRVDIITGLKAMTIWPAYQHFEEKTKGSIEVGKLADFVVLSRDPTRGDLNTIDKIKVTQTIKEGQTVFSLTPEQAKRASLTIGGVDDGARASFEATMRGLASFRETGHAPRASAKPHPFATTAAATHDASCFSSLLSELVMAMAAAPERAVRN